MQTNNNQNQATKISMADRVHPTNEPETAAIGTGTYVIQIPKDQIYKIPPPENDYHFRNFTQRTKSRRRSRCCCRFLSWIIGIVSIVVILAAIVAGVLYLVYRPVSPKYTVTSLAIRNMDLASSSLISPEFDITVESNNRNKKIGIYYEKGSSGEVYYSNVKLSNGVLPVLYQPSRNITVIKTVLQSSGLVLGSNVQNSLVNDEKKQQIPFNLKLTVPVKLKVGSVKTWTFTVKVSCDLVVDKLTAGSKILSKDCDFSVKPWH